VLEFNPTQDDRFPAHKIACHVFALETSAATERLWPQFTDLLLTQRRSARLYDAPSDSFLQCRPSRRVASRRFWEVVIAPRSLLLDAESPDFEQLFVEPKRSYRPSRLLTTAQPSASLVVDMDVEPHRLHTGIPDAQQGLPEHAKVTVDPDITPQSRNDWSFVLSAIEAAVEQGQPVDSDLIQDIAARRHQLAAETYRYVDRPGAGATLETSTRIVEGIVDLYLLGTETNLEG
jgi:hypothetical protein